MTREMTRGEIRRALPQRRGLAGRQMSSAPSRELVCRELVELVTEYLEKALPARTLRRVQRHLAGCPGCTSYVRQLQAVVRTAAAPRGVPLPPEVPALAGPVSSPARSHTDRVTAAPG